MSVWWGLAPFILLSIPAVFLSFAEARAAMRRIRNEGKR